MRDWSILLTPTSTPLSGIEFTHRFPCGDTEKLKQTIRIFFLLRDLCLNLTNETENQLPLTKQEYLVKENDALDLSKRQQVSNQLCFNGLSSIGFRVFRLQRFDRVYSEHQRKVISISKERRIGRCFVWICDFKWDEIFAGRIDVSWSLTRYSLFSSSPK